MSRTGLCRSVRVAAAGALLAVLVLGSAVAAPLFTHDDDGPIVVRHGDSGEPVPVADAAPEVGSLVARANELLAQGSDADAEAVAEVLETARALADAPGRSLAGKLYIEETVRRLRRLQLARVPIEETEVVRRYAGRDGDRLAKAIVLQRAGPALGVDLRTFAGCLELAPFPDDAGPRTVHLEDDGALWTRIAGRPLAFDLVPYGDVGLFLRSVTLGASRSFDFRAKATLARSVLERCRTGAGR